MRSCQFEHELAASPDFLARLKDDDFAAKFYCSLENQAWGGVGKQTYTCSFRHAGSLVAELRNCGEDYLNWYCIWANHAYEMATIYSEVEDELAKLGWEPVEYPV